MKPFALPAPPFDDRRGLYPERIVVATPRGLNSLVRDAAALEGTSKNEFIRRAISARINMFDYASTLNESE